LLARVARAFVARRDHTDDVYVTHMAEKSLSANENSGSTCARDDDRSNARITVTPEKKFCVNVLDSVAKRS